MCYVSPDMFDQSTYVEPLEPASHATEYPPASHLDDLDRRLDRLSTRGGPMRRRAMSGLGYDSYLPHFSRSCQLVEPAKVNPTSNGNLGNYVPTIVDATTIVSHNSALSSHPVFKLPMQLTNQPSEGGEEPMDGPLLNFSQKEQQTCPIEQLALMETQLSISAQKVEDLIASTRREFNDPRLRTLDSINKKLLDTKQQRAIHRNRTMTDGSLVEVPFLDGTSPATTKGLPLLLSVHTVDCLNPAQLSLYYAKYNLPAQIDDRRDRQLLKTFLGAMPHKYIDEEEWVRVCRPFTQ